MTLIHRIDAWLERFIRWHMSVRERLYHPLLELLAWLRILPNAVSFARLTLLVPFLYYSQSSRILAAALLAASIFLDTVDGALARHLMGKGSRGKSSGRLLDAAFDYVTLYAVMWVIISAGGSNAVLAYCHAIIVAALAGIKLVRKKPAVAFSGIYAVVMLFLITGINLSNVYFIIANGIMTVYAAIAVLPLFAEGKRLR